MCVINSCTCGAEGRAHKRDCPLSSRKRMSGRTLFPAPGDLEAQPEAHTEPSKLEPENVSSPQETISTENVKCWGLCLHSQQNHRGFSHSLSHCGGVCWPVAAVLLERCSEHLVFLY